MAKLTIGAPAPDFTLPTDGGGSISLAALRGKKVVVYFYPKADTSGCTVEAKDFSAAREAFAKTNTQVIGVSADPVKAQDKFKSKHGLTISLASDETKTILQSYGVWVEKSMYGRRYMGVERATFLIDADGRIARIWPKVTIAGHVQEVLDAARAL
jgi:peroxiredoxin Q/BCP